MPYLLFHVFPSSFREPRFHARYAVEILADSLRISADFIAYERDLLIRILDLVAHGLVQLFILYPTSVWKTTRTILYWINELCFHRIVD